MATLSLALLTWNLLRSNADLVGETRAATAAAKEAAQATASAAQAADREARATEESIRVMREQMAREWAPILVLEEPPPDLNGRPDTIILPVNVRNLGRGPAVNVIVCVWNENRPGWWRSEPVHVAAGGEFNVSIEKAHGPLESRLFEDASGAQRFVVCCEDQVGTWYRFDSNRPTPSVLEYPFFDYSDKGWAFTYGSMLGRMPGPQS